MILYIYFFNLHFYFKHAGDEYYAEIQNFNSLNLALKTQYSSEEMLSMISGFKLKENKFRLDIRNKLLTERVVRHWHRLPGEAVDAPPLKVSKVRLEQPDLMESVPAHGIGVE